MQQADTLTNQPVKRLCEICAVESDGPHFGVYSCRACAAFFRRTVSLNRKYICREQGNCQIGQTVRSICKSCRLSKCLKMGMRKSGVQEKRKKIGKRKTKNFSGSEQEVETRNETEQQPSSSNVSNINNLSVDVSSAIPILSRALSQYEYMKKLRRIVHDKEFLTEESNPPRLLTTPEALDMEARDIRLVGDFISRSFTEFNNLEPSQKELLFKNFFISFALLETSFDTSKLGRNDIAILPSGDYLNLNNLSFIVDGRRVDFFGRSVSVYQSNIISMLAKHNFDVIEFLALATIILFDIGVIGQSPGCLAICEQMRENVLHELAHYYETKSNFANFTSSAVRLGHLMLLSYSTQRVVKRVREDFELGKLFNFNVINDRLYDIICEPPENR